MSDYILGIRCNGVSMKIDTLTIESDQAGYDYICNVNLSHSWNGNGTYDVSIVNKDYVQGMPIGKWRIIKAWIEYNWVTSWAYLKMIDDNGNETDAIMASSEKRAASLSVSQIRTIFTKAQEVVSVYPSASVCNAVMEFNKLCNKINPKSIKESCRKYIHKEPYYTKTEDFLDSMGCWAGYISDLLKKYKEVKALISGIEDPRSEQLLTCITEDSKKLLCSIFENEK